jgi:hypothetical protein
VVRRVVCMNMTAHNESPCPHVAFRQASYANLNRPEACPAHVKSSLGFSTLQACLLVHLSCSPDVWYPWRNMYVAHRNQTQFICATRQDIIGGEKAARNSGYISTKRERRE